MAQRQARFNVNGLSYTVTGIDKTTSYKDILCTIAKQHDIIKETPAKFNDRQKQRSKTTPRSVRTLPDSYSSTKENLMQVKIISVGKDAISENSFLKRRVKKHQAHGSKRTDTAENDSDIEIYHESRRRMKGLMKMKSKNELKQKAYNKYGKNRVEASKLNVHKNQRNGLIDDCDKISIYYLHEKLEKKREHTGDAWQSRNGSPSVSKRLDVSSEYNIEKRPSVNIPIPDSKCADDQDSGIPSWESEEISSKDDSKIEENGMEIISGFADQNCYPTDVSNNQNRTHLNTCQGLKIQQSTDPMRKKAIFDKERLLATSAIVSPTYGMIQTEGVKFEREAASNSNELSRECVCEGDVKANENWPNGIEKESVCDEVASDYDIIKMEHAESLESNYTTSGIKAGQGFCLFEDKSLSETQTGNSIDFINLNTVENPKTPHEVRTKINLENRGSFILIELGDSQAKCTDENPSIGLEFETILGQDYFCRENIKASKAQQCVEKDSHESEAIKAHREQQPTRKEEELWSMEEVFTERPNARTDETKKHSKNGIDIAQSLPDQHANEGSSLMRIDMKDKIDGGINNMQDSFAHTVDVDNETITNCNIQSKCDKKLLRRMKSAKLENMEAKEEQHKNQHREEAGLYTDQLEVLELRSNTVSSNTTSSNTTSSNTTSSSTDTRCSCSGFNFKHNGNSVKFSQEEDKLLVKFANKFARQLEHDFISKFCSNFSEKDKMPIGKNIVEFGSTSTVNSINERKELWKEYVNVCEQIFKITGKLFLFDLKAEKSSFQLEQIKELESFHDDGSLEDDENEIIKEILEFRIYLKKVTMASRKNRLQLKENQSEIDRLELQLASKRSQLMYFESIPTRNRCQNIPRRLLRNCHAKQGRLNAI